METIISDIEDHQTIESNSDDESRHFDDIAKYNVNEGDNCFLNNFENQQDNCDPESDQEKDSQSDTDEEDSRLNESFENENVEVCDTFEVSSVKGKTLLHNDKCEALNRKPCQPSKHELSKRTMKINEFVRHCSENQFYRKDGTKRAWLTYSLENDTLHCIPCLLFSDQVIRGKNQRKNQGNVFVKAGFTNWRKQFRVVQEHEESQSHINSK